MQRCYTVCIKYGKYTVLYRLLYCPCQTQAHWPSFHPPCKVCVCVTTVRKQSSHRMDIKSVRPNIPPHPSLPENAQGVFEKSLCVYERQREREQGFEIANYCNSVYSFPYKNNWRHFMATSENTTVILWTPWYWIIAIFIC